MSTLKFAMLGLIARAPLTGYEISKAFDGRIGSLWGARHSQIYPELKKMTEEGLIVCTVLRDVQEKKLYSITEKGEAAFRSWVLEEEEVYRPPKDSLRLKLYFCDLLSPEEYQSVLIHARTQHRNRLEWMREHQKEVYPSPPEEFTAELGDYMLMKGGIFREQAYLDWIDHCIEHVRSIRKTDENS